MASPEIRQLTSMLGSLDYPTRMHALHGLREYGAAAALPLIEILVSPGSEFVAAACAYSLLRENSMLAAPHVAMLARAMVNAPFGTMVESVLADIGAPAVAPLADVAREAHADLRIHVLRTYLQMAEPPIAALPVVMTCLISEDDDVRRYAAGVLGKLGKEAEPAVFLLREHLNDRSPRVCAAAAEALGCVGFLAEEACERLGSLLTSHLADEVLTDVLRAFRPLAPFAVPYLSTLRSYMQDLRCLVAASACETVFYVERRDAHTVGSRTAAEWIELLRKDAPEDTALQALEALNSLRAQTEDAAYALLTCARTRYGLVRERAVDTLVSLGPVGLPACCLWSEDIRHVEDRLVALECIEQYGSGGLPAFPCVLECLGDRSAPVREAAERAVLAMHEPVVSLLTAALESDRKGTRRGAARALSRMAATSQEARVLIPRLALNSDPEIRKIASRAQIQLL